MVCRALCSTPHVIGVHAVSCTEGLRSTETAFEMIQPETLGLFLPTLSRYIRTEGASLSRKRRHRHLTDASQMQLHTRFFQVYDRGQTNLLQGLQDCHRYPHHRLPGAQNSGSLSRQLHWRRTAYLRIFVGVFTSFGCPHAAASRRAHWCTSSRLEIL